MVWVVDARSVMVWCKKKGGGKQAEGGQQTGQGELERWGS